jgi:hypothetical protein
VAIVAEEGRSFHGSQGIGAPMPPDDWPVEFVEWGGDFPAGAVAEPGFLLLTADRDRRIEGRFRTIQPILLFMNVQGIGSVAFKVTIPATPLLTLPPETLEYNGVTTIKWGGTGSQAVEWFFLRSGSSVTLEATDDIDAGCNPSQFSPCSEFQNWSDDCSGSGLCTLTPTATLQSVFANAITRTN